MKKILIIPDVHGRDFWIKPVEECLNDKNIHIIFEGDYLDLYPHEFDWSQDINWNMVAIDRFKNIIELKRTNPDRITLLIGNHDAGYCIGDDVCSCRRDRANSREIERLFNDNRSLFQIAEERDINGKHFVFSHAGILKGWVKAVWGEEDMNREGFNVVDELNNAWLIGHYGICHALGDYDNYRGWGGSRYASPIWSDIRSWIKVTPEETYGYNIVGHTQCEDEPIVLDTIADLDVRKVFYLDDEGNIRDYETDAIQGPSGINI